MAKPTMDIGSTYGSVNSVVKRPNTAFYAKKSAYNETVSMATTARGFGTRSSYNGNQTTINCKRGQVKDLEGREALSDIDQFESTQCKKKDNRYPQAHLQTEFKLDNTMRSKIQARAQITLKKEEENMKKYSQKRLAKGFKSFRGVAMESSTSQIGLTPTLSNNLLNSKD